jgi:hypothetical protein
MAPDPSPWDEAIRKLSGPSLDREKVSELVGIVSKSLGNAELRPFPKGIPWPDGILVHAVLDAGTLTSLFELLRASEHIDAVRIFPRGIVNPELFVTEIEMS